MVPNCGSWHRQSALRFKYWEDRAIQSAAPPWMPPKTPTVLRHGQAQYQEEDLQESHLLGICHGAKAFSRSSIDHIAKYDGDWQRERADNRTGESAMPPELNNEQIRTSFMLAAFSSSQIFRSLPGEEFRLEPRILVSQFGRPKNKYGKIYKPGS